MKNAKSIDKHVPGKICKCSRCGSIGHVDFDDHEKAVKRSDGIICEQCDNAND